LLASLVGFLGLNGFSHLGAVRSRVDAVGRDVPASDIAPDSDDSEEPLDLAIDLVLVLLIA